MRLTVIAAALLTCASAYARDETLTVTSTGQNGISVTLTGAIAYCDSQLGAFIGSPVATVTGTNVDIESTIIVGECAAPPPGFVAPSPVPYSITAPLGNLSDGTYTVHWNFVGGIPQTFTSTFTVARGEVVALPALSPMVTALLALALAAMALRVIRS